MPAEDVKDQSVSELVQQASNQAAAHVRDEVKLAQLEVQEKAKHAGVGWAVRRQRAGGPLRRRGPDRDDHHAARHRHEPWLAGLIVAVVLLAVAGILALTGKKQVEQATPPAPEKAIDSVKTDVDEIKKRVSRG